MLGGEGGGGGGCARENLTAYTHNLEMGYSNVSVNLKDHRPRYIPKAEGLQTRHRRQRLGQLFYPGRAAAVEAATFCHGLSTGIMPCRIVRVL
jgi:hypothetical protein